MKIFRNKKLLIITFSILIVLIIGATNSDTYKNIARSQKIVNEVYKHLILNYADELDPEEFTKSSINKMLSDLDPYTVYLEAEERENLDMLTEGKYGGVGIQLGSRDDQLIVVAPMDDSPAQQAGIMSGDMIIKIDGQDVTELSLNDAAKLIRGKKGTSVVITILRAEEEPIDFHLTRSDIIINDIAYAGMINDNTGYISISRFSNNLPREVETELRSFKDKKVRNLIIDLRDNPGGLLSSAIEVLEMLVPKGEKLLWTKGRSKESNKEFISRRTPIIDKDVKIAVLINEGSASASEIVSGVIQDLDRGIIVGEKSYGKGLVQSVYSIDPQRSLKITTAKYYIPSGRLIQKPDYLNKKVIQEIAKPDSIFTTKAGRTVKGGGGIEPDYTMEEEVIGPLTLECWRKNVFFTFATQHKNDYASFDYVIKDEKLLDKLTVFIKEQKLDIKISGQKQFEQSQEELKKHFKNDAKLNYAFNTVEKFIQEKIDHLFLEENQELENGLLSNFAQVFEGDKGRIRFSITHDPIIHRARDLLLDPMAYAQTLRTVSHN